jgi:GT2 family glycosyltransferase
MVKVALCVLSYKRHDLTAQTVAANIANCGYENIGLFVQDTYGIAKASNEVLRRAYAEGYGAFVMMGNDILMPDGWLYSMISNCHSLSGMIAFPDTPKANISNEMVIGNFLISRRVVDKVGAFDERFDPYGAIDLDYNRRCTEKGFQNYYLPGGIFKHIHEHDGLALYGYDKKTKVDETWHIHRDERTLGHIPLIEMVQMI